MSNIDRFVKLTSLREDILGLHYSRDVIVAIDQITHIDESTERLWVGHKNVNTYKEKERYFFGLRKRIVEREYGSKTKLITVFNVHTTDGSVIKSTVNPIGIEAEE